MRVFFAGLVPLFILVAITNLTGAWALSVFGFISLLFLPWPCFLFFFGERLRARSRFAPMHLAVRRRGGGMGGHGMGGRVGDGDGMDVGMVDAGAVGPMQQQIMMAEMGDSRA